VEQGNFASIAKGLFFVHVSQGSGWNFFQVAALSKEII